MKKRIGIVIILIIMATLSILILKISEIRTHKTAVASKISQLENIPMLDIDSTDFNLKRVGVGNTILILFNSECDYCHHQIDEIKKNITNFRNTQIILLSEEPIANIIKYKNSTKMTFNNVRFAKIRASDSYDHLGNMIIPSTLIYNEDLSLKKKISGETKAEIIIAELD